MTKDAYFEMCEALGSVPVDSEIPIEYEDLYPEVQYALVLYQKLKDDWDTMNGNYLGKQFTGIQEIFSIFEVLDEDRKTMFNLLNIIDTHRSKVLAEKKPKS